MTTDPQTAADAAERVQAFLDAWDATDYLTEMTELAGPFDGIPALTTYDLRVLLADRARLVAELEQAKRGLAVPVLRHAWRNGWSDRARAVRDAVRVSDNDRDAYERAFARYMSEDPTEADKDPYRPLDEPDDPAATRPAITTDPDATSPARCPECPHGTSAHRVTTGCIRCPCNHGRTTAPTRPASALTDPPEGQRTHTPAVAPQRGTGDDEEGGDRG